METGYLKFYLNGEWVVDDFANLLKKINIIYQKLNAFLLLCESDENEKTSYRGVVKRSIRNYMHSIHVSPIESYSIHDDYNKSFENLVLSGQRRTQSLKISKIDIASPGLVELIGQLNPLKVIADFITSWRHENTLREDNIQKNEIEKIKVVSDLIKDLYKNAHIETWEDEIHEEFYRHTLEEALSMLQGFACDLRLKKVEFINKSNSNDKRNA